MCTIVYKPVGTGVCLPPFATHKPFLTDNVALHFKLEIPNDASGENFEDAQFRYTPKLDPSRDRPLIEILPDFLVEEITFPRPHAIKFYARVMKALAEAPPPPESPE